MYKLNHSVRAFKMIFAVLERRQFLSIIKFKIATLTFEALETGQLPYLAQQLCPYAPN